MTKATIANFTKGNQTDDQARHPRQCGGDRPLLDGAASGWWADDRERSEVRPAGTRWGGRATSRKLRLSMCNSRPRSRAI
jgi:hypothetical protein